MLRPQTLNPNRLLLDFKSLANRAAGGALSLRFDLDPGLDPIRVDPAQFESAVLNLVVNARDAMDPGRADAAITVRSRNVLLGKADVADRGLRPGPMSRSPSSITAWASRPTWSRASSSPSSPPRMSARERASASARSTGSPEAPKASPRWTPPWGRGTTIRLLFPRSVDPAGEEADTRAAGTIPLRRAVEGEIVLLVEDDEEVLGMAVESLEDLHYEVVVARNAAEALDHLRGSQRIDIMFSDIMMPGGMNGTQLAVEARRVRPDIKVLLTSGYVADLGEDQVVGHGETTVLNKPYRRDELARSLRIVLGRRGQRTGRRRLPAGRGGEPVLKGVTAEARTGPSPRSSAPGADTDRSASGPVRLTSKRRFSVGP